ncbi:hypothetical protein VIGAN_02066900, partial [Vigna angularis var. angularis]
MGMGNADFLLGDGRWVLVHSESMNFQKEQLLHRSTTCTSRKEVRKCAEKIIKHENSAILSLLCFVPFFVSAW